MQDLAVTIHKYEALDTSQIDLKVGDHIVIDFRHKSNWWQGTNQRTKQFGRFPCKYVVSDTYSTRQISKSLSTNICTQQNEKRQSCMSLASIPCVVAVKYEFHPKEYVGVELKSGDFVEIIQRRNSGW
eukprot:292929_1